jgi:hypothetical protein
MTEIIIAEILGVLFAWVVTGYAIWKWGPGLRKRTVSCPELKVHAQILADQRESEFGCLRVVDLSACSLVPSAVPACRKACLARL